MDISERTAVVGSCTSRPEAELQCHVLEAEGIPAAIASDDAGGLHPELAFTRCATYRIVVPESQVDDARNLLASFEPPADAPSASIPGDDAADAQVGMGSRATLWIAAIIAAVLVAGVISNLVNVFTGS